MKLKHVNILVIFLNVLFIAHLAYPFLPIFMEPEVGAIGIIGGADGPTALFISFKLVKHIPLLSLIVLNSVIIAVNIKKRVIKRKDKKKIAEEESLPSDAQPNSPVL